MSGVNVPAKKPINRRSKTKEAVGDKNVRNEVEVNSQLQKLGTLKGLSIMRAGDGKEPNNPVIAKASKNALGDLSSQLEKRKSKEAMIADLKAAKKGIATNPVPSKAKLATGGTLQSVQVKNRSDSPKPQPQFHKNKSDDETMKALLKSSLPKTLNKPVVFDPNSPAMQRKLLFEKLAADEKLREARKLSKSTKSFAKKSSNNDPKLTEPTESSNTKKLMKDSISLLNRPIKKEPELSNTNTEAVCDEVPALLNEVGVRPAMKKNRSNHRAPQMNIKKEPVSEQEDIKSVDNQSMPTKPHPPHIQPPPPKAKSLTPEQVNILTDQFEIKDYLSRKEMRTVATKANLTDAQVRDWFKARRIEEDTPMIVDEKNTDVQLSSIPVVIKQEPVEEDTSVGEGVGQVTTANVKVKQEPDDETDSAVLDPLTGKLLKKSNVDKKIEEILAKAPLLDSLTRKIEMVKRPKTDLKDKVKNQISDIIGILDDEIEITKENIVNPGPKEKPLAKTLNKFLSQVEQLEMSMDVNEFSKNIEIERIIKEASRKDETISELRTEVNEKKNEAKYLGKELQDKNDEIESILLNSVSKETFVRTQFQSLTSEVRKLKQEKTDAIALQEKIRELESKLRKKGHETEDLKLKYDSSQTLLKEKDQELLDLEEMSTKMIGDITKGIGEKLALSKSRELKLKQTLEKNERLEADLKELGLTFKQQNEDLIRIKAEEKKLSDQLMEKCEELTETVQQRYHDIVKLKSENESLTLKKEEGKEAIKGRDDEIERLKEQVSSLTKRFRSKVKEIQETLSNYNKTLKSKNQEIEDKAQETIELQEQNSTQGKIIKKLKDTIGKHVQDIAQLKEAEETLKTNLIEQKSALEEHKILTKSSKPNYRKRKLTSEAADEIHSKRSMLDDIPEKKCFTLINELQFSSMIRLPSFESLISIQLPLPVLSLGLNWPLVSYKPNFILEKLQSTCSPASEVQKPELENNVSCKRKQVSVSTSAKRFRIIQANRPVSSLRRYRL